MSDLLLYGILGLGTGTAYVLLSLGIVVVHKGSNVVNFAQGGIAMITAVLVAQMQAAGLPGWVAVPIGLTSAAALGALIYLVVMRPLRNAPSLARNVAALGVMLALLATATVAFGSVNSLNVPPLIPSTAVTVAGATFGSDRLVMLGIACCVTAVLALVFRRTRMGLSTRAVAENEVGATLLGYSPIRIGTMNWAIGSLLAGMAGVLIAPISGIDPPSMTFLVVPALAAALFGGFNSFALTLVGGLSIGVLQAISRVIAPGVAGISDLIPLLFIMAVMIARSKAIPSRDALILGRPPRALAGRFRVWYLVVPLGFAIFLAPLIEDQYVIALQTSACLGLVFLSQTVVTGFAGQISLAQMTFAGIGGLISAQSGTLLGLPFPLPIIVAALVAFPLGALIGLPALRVRGINLGVLTLSMATAAYTFIFGQQFLTGGPGISTAPVPEVFGLSLNAALYPSRFLIVAIVFLVIGAVAVSLIRRGAFGRRLLAVRENERAAAATGVSVTRTKLLAFSVASTIAAVGGALIAYQSTMMSYELFQPANSVSIVAGSYIFGIGSPLGAVLAGGFASGGLIPTLLSAAFSIEATAWIPLVMSLLLIFTVVSNPDGAVPFVRDALARAMERRNKKAKVVPAPKPKETRK